LQRGSDGGVKGIKMTPEQRSMCGTLYNTRLKQGIPRAKLAREMCVHIDSIRRWEKGKSYPKPSNFIRWAISLGYGKDNDKFEGMKQC